MKVDSQIKASIIKVAGEWAVTRLNRESKEKTSSQQLRMYFEQSYKDILDFISPSTKDTGEGEVPVKHWG